MPSAMSEGDALLRAVIDNPADDAPRLVYADWCEEHGDPERAEFIRIQCEPERRRWIAPADLGPEEEFQYLLDVRSRNPDWLRLATRAEALFRVHWRGWSQSVLRTAGVTGSEPGLLRRVLGGRRPPFEPMCRPYVAPDGACALVLREPRRNRRVGIYRVGFGRGFVYSVGVGYPGPVSMEGIKDLFQNHPLTELWVESPMTKALADLVNHGHLRHVRRMKVVDPDSALVRQLLTADRGPRLTELRLRVPDISGNLVESLRAAGPGGGLETLELGLPGEFTAEVARRLSAVAGRPGLRKLSIGFHGQDEEAVPILAERFGAPVVNWVDLLVFRIAGDRKPGILN